MTEITSNPVEVLPTKLKEIFFAVLPVTIIVLLLHFFATPMELPVLFRFLIGAVLVVIGLGLFLTGVDFGVTPLGALSGEFVAKHRKLLLMVLVGLVLGFLISIAEPGLIVLSNQVSQVSGGAISFLSILLAVSAGMGVMMVIGFMRMAYGWPLRIVLTIFYLLIGILALFATSDFLAISFDASGATTGVIAVPFILALATGIAKLKRKGEADESDNFGLVAITSIGAIIAVLLLQNFTHIGEIYGEFDVTLAQGDTLFSPFIREMPGVLQDSLVAMVPLILVSIILQFIAFKLPRAEFFRMLTGFGLAFIGLIVFFLGVNGGFMNVGALVGNALSALPTGIIVLVGFALGVVTIIAEPAVYVLTHEIEHITHGNVKRIPVLLTLAGGVGVAIAIAMLRIVIPGLNLWHFLLPGYIIALILAYLAPDLFVGLAWDAGGVATGPITATFILAFTHGVANATPHANVLIDGFGMIALVAMMPIITLQVFGLVYRLKNRASNEVQVLEPEPEPTPELLV